MNKEVGIITYEQFENRKKDSVGSSRLRGTWLVRNWPQAELWHVARRYKAMIFQKSYYIRFMQHYDGIKILDLCDPDWLEQKPVIETIQEVDAITCSSNALAEYVRTMTDKPVHFIPDRIDLELHKDRKVHRGDARSAVWFGYSNNFRMIDEMLASIKRLNLNLTVIAETPYYPTAAVQGIDDTWFHQHVVNIRYDQPMINLDILKGDIVLNSRIDFGKFRFKSDNKTIIAWALGMPVARNSEELERFMKEEERIQEAKQRLEEVGKFWDIKLSVKQFQGIISDIEAQRSNVAAA